jgi:hypothetical protein
MRNVRASHFDRDTKMHEGQGKVALSRGWTLRRRNRAWVAQMVERVLGKDEVTGSIPVPGSKIG